MRIGELARQLRVSADTLRFYEREGWLPRPKRSMNGYRAYDTDDLEHLRLLLDLRRMDLPLESAGRLAAWCHSGHCEETTAELPRQLAERRQVIASRIEGLRQLDGRIAKLERHLTSARAVSNELQMLNVSGPCCSAAAAVADSEDGGCACCATGVN